MQPGDIFANQDHAGLDLGFEGFGVELDDTELCDPRGFDAVEAVDQGGMRFDISLRYAIRMMVGSFAGNVVRSFRTRRGWWRFYFCFCWFIDVVWRIQPFCNVTGVDVVRFFVSYGKLLGPGHGTLRVCCYEVGSEVGSRKGRPSES